MGTQPEGGHRSRYISENIKNRALPDAHLSFFQMFPAVSILRVYNYKFVRQTKDETAKAVSEIEALVAELQ